MENILLPLINRQNLPILKKYYSLEMNTEIETNLTDLLQEKNFLTFGAVSAELGIHVNLAKNYLEELQSKVEGKVFYYLTGLKDNICIIKIVPADKLKGKK